MPTQADPSGDIQAALDNYLNGLSLGGLPIAFENTEYDPQPTVPFLSVKMVARTQVVLTPGRFGPVEHDGTYQISIYRPVGDGLDAALALAKTLAAAFKIGTQFAAGSTFVQVLNVRIPPTVQEPQWLNQPVLIDWYCIQQ